MIRVVLPAHLRALAKTDGEVTVSVPEPATIGGVLDALETAYPTLRGTIREHETHKRRPFVRFFACSEDYSHEPAARLLPGPVVAGKEPFIILGAIAGG